MKTLCTTLALLAVYMAIPSCAHVQPVIDDSKFCVNQADRDVAKQILPEVEKVLSCALEDVVSTPDCVFNGIADMAKRWGVEAINCALEQIANAKLAKSGMVDGLVRERAGDVLKKGGAAKAAQVAEQPSND